jgi:hypothetical protein
MIIVTKLKPTTTVFFSPYVRYHRNREFSPKVI